MVKRTKAELERMLKALYDAPYFLELLLRNKAPSREKSLDYAHRYTFGTIITEDAELLKEYFYAEKNKDK